MTGKTKSREEAKKDGDAIVVKKYANRRLYNTATSSYVTLEDLSTMVKEGDDFIVFDAKTGDDITRSVLTQIIFEQESRGQNLLPTAFLRRLIRFYGDSVQSLVPRYLEMTMESFFNQREAMRERFTETWSGATAMEAFEEQARQNIALFEQTMRMFTPFGAANGGEDGATTEAASKEPPASQDGDDAKALAEMRRQIDTLQRRLDAISGPKPTATD